VGQLRAQVPRPVGGVLVESGGSASAGSGVQVGAHVADNVVVAAG